MACFQNNFVDDFPKISLAKKKNKAQKALESLWLDLLVNLSFSTDGQNMILKVPGAKFISSVLSQINKGCGLSGYRIFTQSLRLYLVQTEMLTVPRRSLCVL